MSKKTHTPVTIESLGLTPDEMTKFASGARFLYAKKMAALPKSGALSKVKKPTVEK